MAAPMLDNEFLQYWNKLTLVEKESLLSVAKNYVQLKEETTDTDTLRKNMIQEERERYLSGNGNSYSWEAVKEMAMNKEKRHAL